MKLLRSLQGLPTWQKVLIATLVLLVPAGIVLGGFAFRWFSQRRSGS